ncbi:MAG: hypothetical protein OEV42_05430 [Deltaproteobacteria bacterium]|nr:hypothetical protein [Deltaproteobacteria bacterium]
MFRKGAIAVTVLLLTATLAVAGGWDKKKGLDKITLKGTLLCVGCSLKKLDGANAQCSLYSQHGIGFKTADGTIWNIVENAKGHEVIRTHKLIGKKGKEATITGYIYPVANMIEIDDIKVEGITWAQIQKAAYEEDMLMAKRLASRKLGEAPSMAHDH